MRTDSYARWYWEQQRELLLADVRMAIPFMLSRLTYREREIIKRRWGIGCQSLTLKEIAAICNVCPERIRQIEARAIRKLQCLRITQLLNPTAE